MTNVDKTVPEITLHHMCVAAHFNYRVNIIFIHNLCIYQTPIAPRPVSVSLIGVQGMLKYRTYTLIRTNLLMLHGVTDHKYYLTYFLYERISQHLMLIIRVWLK